MQLSNNWQLESGGVINAQVVIKNILIRRESDTYLAIISRHCWSRQIMMKMEDSADESHSAGWKLQLFIYFHRDLSTPATSDNSQVGVALFPSC